MQSNTSTTDASGTGDDCGAGVGDLWKGATCSSNLATESGHHSNDTSTTTIELPMTAVNSGTSISKRLQRVRPSVSSLHCLSFHDVHYEVTQRKCFKRQPNKIILNSISGLMLPGLNAIMGPTGSGKTSLLDVLADRKSKTALSGAVLFNGNKRPPNFKTLVGYVVQDDVVMGTLSIRENLYFSAALRLPSKMSHKERKMRVDKVVQELGLENVQNSKVGTEFIRGVSGGERKRTNIGMELIIEPQVLFLDEPTTGLDANTAVSVVQLLKGLSQVKNRIVIMSIHQPRYSIFKLFDSLTLLSVGNMVYHGSAHKALEYFDRIGFKCEEHENPADYFLDIVISDEQEQKANEKSSSDALVSKYRKSTEHQELHNVIDPILANYKAERDVRDYPLWNRWCHKYEANFFWQMLVVMTRSFINLLRNPGTSILQILTLTFFAIVIGGIYWQLGTGFLGFQDRIGVFFFIATNQAFGSLSAIELFIKQRSLFIHEAASGYYGVLPFFIAKVLVDILTFRLIPNILFIVITYFMVGFQLSASRFFTYFLFVVMTNISAVSIAFGISAGTRVVGIANLFIAIIFVVSMLFGGLLIALESLPPWVQWLKYFSFIRYGIEGMAINEMDGLTFDCSQDQQGFVMGEVITMGGNGSAPIVTNCTFDGLQRLTTLGYQVDWLWYDFLALVILSLVFLAIAYVVLALVKKEK